MYVEELDLPPIPAEVVKQLLEQNPDTGEYNFVCEPAYDGIAHFLSYTTDTSKIPWFKENNLEQYYWSVQILRGGKDLVAHRDDRRTHVVMFIIDPGGLDVKTRWYKKLLDKEYTPIQPIPQEELELDYEKVLEQGKWYKLSVQPPHSVHDMQTDRICLIRQIPDIPLDLL